VAGSSDAPTAATEIPLVRVDNVSVKQLEFWPEYGSGPPWTGGDRVDLTELGFPPNSPDD